jgi:hypothetical protein
MVTDECSNTVIIFNKLNQSYDHFFLIKLVNKSFESGSGLCSMVCTSFPINIVLI